MLAIYQNVSMEGCCLDESPTMKTRGCGGVGTSWEFSTASSGVGTTRVSTLDSIASIAFWSSGVTVGSFASEFETLFAKSDKIKR